MTALSQSDENLQTRHRERARLLRKVSNSTPLERTMRKAVRVLAEAGIPSLIVGGYAVQEHGYARFTSDVDVIVPKVVDARGILSINGFRENSGSSMTVTDRVSKVEVNLLPGGHSVGPGPLILPIPQTVSSNPTFVDLRTLLEMKLSSYVGSPLNRAKDFSDVVELIKANKLTRSFVVAPEVAELLEQIINGLEAEQNR